MQIEFDPLLHRYTYAGVGVPGVNEVMDSIGVRNRCADCKGSGCGEVGSCNSCNGTGYTSYRSLTGSEYIGDNTGARFGTALHDFIKYDQQGIKCDYDPALQPWIEGYFKFKNSHNIKYQLIEEPFYHPIYKYAGTPDWFGHLYIQKPKTITLLLLDWKSGTTISKLFGPAFAAYEELIKYNLKTKRKIHKLCVQLLPNDYKTIEYREAHFSIFLSFLNIYKQFQKKES